MKAGKLVTGESMCEEALRNKTARLVIVSCDASDNTKEKFINKTFYYHVPIIVCGSRDVLSRLTGKSNRAVYAVTDDNLAASIKKHIEAGCGNEVAQSM
jgi:ribosomal protein L7Ae-like RNA K-turn-binding protein